MQQEGAKPVELSMRELMMQFESLGENCEFGIVQRAHKAEPLGLFRWASVTVDTLMRMLDARFENLGDPAAVRVRLANGEYMIDETRYKMTYHAFAKEGEIEPEALHDREYKRLRYLAGKMIEDLEDAEKIFVLKRDNPLTEAEVAPLVHLLRTYGHNTLLWAAIADAGHPPGTVERLAEGLVRGRVDRFADPNRVPATTPVESWTIVCSNAWRSLRQPGAALAGTGISVKQ
jgi:hypothetical protein